MPAVTYNFIVEQGSDFSLDFQYNDAANNPIDLSNSDVVFTMIPNSGSTIRFSASDNSVYETEGFSLSADSAGIISLRFNSAYTNNFTFDTAQYDLDVISLSNGINGNLRISTGLITIIKRVSIYPTIPLLSVPDGGDGDTGGGDGGDTGNNTIIDSENLCNAAECLDLDVYSVVYPGSGLTISDSFNTTVSGSVTTADTREIENVELSVNRLNHTSVQDLQFILCPPSGDKVLLSANDKITNYDTNFSFMFSNKATASTYLYNVANGDYCNILDKTSLVNYNDENLLGSLNHLIGATGLTGDWNLIVRDTDPMGSGYIDSWKLVLTYKP